MDHNAFFLLGITAPNKIAKRKTFSYFIRKFNNNINHTKISFANKGLNSITTMGIEKRNLFFQFSIRRLLGLAYKKNYRQKTLSLVFDNPSMTKNHRLKKNITIKSSPKSSLYLFSSKKSKEPICLSGSLALKLQIVRNNGGSYVYSNSLRKKLEIHASHPVHLLGASSKLLLPNNVLPINGENKMLRGENKLTVNSYWNQCFDKGRLKNFILWFFINNGEHKTVQLVEQFKKLGFEYATKAGISLGLEDLKIPPKKSFLIFEAEKETSQTVKQYKRGDITGVERFQRLIDTWHRTSEQLKQEVIDHFEATDVLNPVYMMAFSGARGNISQVRQLVGMRGLMANPQGQIIDFPIRSNFREGLTLTEYIISSYGARKGIVDTALRTANAGYLTRRLVDVAQHVIISNFDCGTQRGIFLSDMKEGNKTILSLQNRLIGRVCARDISENGKKIANRNDEITIDLAFQISKSTKKVFVRSALTCETKKLVCQLCYGWSLAQGNLVSIGEAIGVIAAQSIGEPGTQLTMRTFHTGGVFSGDISDQIRMPFNGIIRYNAPIPGTLIRTPEGKIAFLTKSSGSFTASKRNIDVGTSLKEKQKEGTIEQDIKKPNNLKKRSETSLLAGNNTKKYKIPAYTLLFVRDGEMVSEKEVVAQISSISKQKNATDDAELTIKSEMEGQLYLNLLELKETKVGPKLTKKEKEKELFFGTIMTNNIMSNLNSTKIKMDSLFSAWNWGNAWILSGKVYHSAQPSLFFPKIGDYINHQSSIIISEGNSLTSNVSGLAKLDIPTSAKAAKYAIPYILTSNTGSYSKKKLSTSINNIAYGLQRGSSKNCQRQFLNWLKANRIDQKSMERKIFNKSLPISNFEFLSFSLSSVIYKKVGYFAKLNCPQTLTLKDPTKLTLQETKLANANRRSLGDLRLFNGILNIKDPLFIIPQNAQVSLNKSLVNLYPSNWQPSFNFALQWFPSFFQTKTAGILALEEIGELHKTHNWPKGQLEMGSTKVDPILENNKTQKSFFKTSSYFSKKSQVLIIEKLMCLTKLNFFIDLKLNKNKISTILFPHIQNNLLTKEKNPNNLLTYLRVNPQKENKVNFSRLFWIPNSQLAKGLFKTPKGDLGSSLKTLNMISKLSLIKENRNGLLWSKNRYSSFKKTASFTLSTNTPVNLVFSFLQKKKVKSQKFKSNITLLLAQRVNDNFYKRFSNINFFSHIEQPSLIKKVHALMQPAIESKLFKSFCYQDKMERKGTVLKTLNFQNKQEKSFKGIQKFNNWIYCLSKQSFKITKLGIYNSISKKLRNFYYPGQAINSELTFDNHIVYVEPILIPFSTTSSSLQINEKTLTIINWVANKKCRYKKPMMYRQSSYFALSIQKVEEYNINSLHNKELLNIKTEISQLCQFHENTNCLSTINFSSEKSFYKFFTLNNRSLILKNKLIFNKSFLSSKQLKNLKSAFINKQQISRILSKYPNVDIKVVPHFLFNTNRGLNKTINSESNQLQFIEKNKKNKNSLTIINKPKKAVTLVTLFIALPSLTSVFSSEKIIKTSKTKIEYPFKEYKFDFYPPLMSYSSSKGIHSKSQISRPNNIMFTNNSLKTHNLTKQLLKNALKTSNITLLNSICFFKRPFLSRSLTYKLEPSFYAKNQYLSKVLGKKSFVPFSAKFFVNQFTNGQFISPLVTFAKTFSYSPFEGEVLQITSPFNKSTKIDSIHSHFRQKNNVVKQWSRAIEVLPKTRLRNQFSQLIENELTFLKIKQHTSIILTKADLISYYLPTSHLIQTYKNQEYSNSIESYFVNRRLVYLNQDLSNLSPNLQRSLEQKKKKSSHFISFANKNSQSEKQVEKLSSGKEELKIWKLPQITSGFPTVQNQNLSYYTPDRQYSLTSFNRKKINTKQIKKGKIEKNNNLAFLLGDFIVSGDSLLLNYNLTNNKIVAPKSKLRTAVSNSGQIIHLNREKITLRKGQSFFVSPKAILHKFDGDFIDPKSPVITLSYQRLKTGDIIQGIPKIEQFFEARTTKRGRLFRDSLPNLLKALFKHYRQELPLDKAVRQSLYKIQQIIVDGVLRVYRSQGVTIADKHLEIIVKQMTSKVRILEGGRTGFFRGEIADLEFVERVNKFIKKKIQYEPLVLGITKSSLEVYSFLSAASFQQTTRVLSGAAISRKKDFLKGLKENVILGNLIPAGTGYLVYLNDLYTP